MSSVTQRKSRISGACCAAALFSVSLFATPLAALTPAWLVCGNADGSTSQFMVEHAPDDPVLPGLTTFEVFPEGAARATQRVIAHCATGKAVAYEMPEDITKEDAVYDLVESPQRMTFRGLARRINRLGVSASYGWLESGNCACNPASYRSSF